MRELTERDKSLRIGLAWHHMARHNAARGRWLLAAGAALGAGGVDLIRVGVACGATWAVDRGIAPRSLRRVNWTSNLQRVGT